MKLKFIFLILIGFAFNNLWGQYKTRLQYSLSFNNLPENTTWEVETGDAPNDDISFTSAPTNPYLRYFRVRFYVNGSMANRNEYYFYLDVSSSNAGHHISTSTGEVTGEEASLSWDLYTYTPDEVIIFDSEGNQTLSFCADEKLLPIRIAVRGGGPYYKLYRKIDGGDYNFVTTFSGNIYVDTILSIHTSSVQYKVYSCKEYGSYQSPGSATSGTVYIYPAAPSSLDVSLRDITCSLTDGYIKINSATGGDGPFTVSGTNTDNGQTIGSASNVSFPYTFDNLTDGNYEIYVVNQDGHCSSTFTYALDNSYRPFDVNTESYDECEGNITAQLSETGHGNRTFYLQKQVSGGISKNNDKAYTWQDVDNSGLTYATTYMFDNISDGIYRIKVVDAADCKVYTNETTIYEYPSFTYNAPATPPCHTSNIGNVLVAATSDANYTTYNCSLINSEDDIVSSGTIMAPGASVNLPLGEVGGNFKLKIQNSVGCVKYSSFNVENPPELMLELDTITDDCGSGGTIVVSGQGGTPIINGYKFQISNSENIYWGENYTFSELKAGNYTVWVIDLNNCKDSADYRIYDKEIKPKIKPSLYNNTYNITCEDAGEINFYTGQVCNYTLSYDGEVVASGNVLNEYTIRNITEQGIYRLEIYNNSCSTSNDVIMTKSPNFKEVVINKDSASTLYDITCENDAVLSFTTTGGSDYSEIRWTLNGSGIADVDTIFAETPGEYAVYVKDIYGCDIYSSVVNLDKSPEITSLNIYKTAASANYDIRCDSAALLVATVLGHNITDWQWSLNNNLIADNDSVIADEPGNYIISVTDQYGCSDTDSVALTKSPVFTDIQVIKDTLPHGLYDIYCDTPGKISATTSGGTVNSYTHYYYISENDTISGNNSATITNPGNYFVKVIDQYGCEISSDTLEMTKSPDFENISIDITPAGNDFDIYCNQDAVLTASADDTHTITGYLWSNAENTATISVSQAGQYTVTITDLFGCVISDTISVTKSPEIDYLSIFSPAIIDGYNITCSDSGHIFINDIHWQNTADSYQISKYFWNGTEGNDTLVVAEPGEYSLSVIDEHGCVAYSNDTVTMTKPAEFVVDLQTDTVGIGGYNITCNNPGQISVNLSGAGATNPINSYDWFLYGNSLDTHDSELDSIFTEGDYSVVVTDNYGCFDRDTITLTAAPSLQLDVTKVLDTLNREGDLFVHINGGVPGYKVDLFLFNDIDSVFENVYSGTDTVFYDLSNGLYNLVVTDTNNCENSMLVDIFHGIFSMSPNTSIQDISCKGSNTGSLTTVISGGTEPYRYKLYRNGTFVAENSGLSDSISIQNLQAGTYRLEIWDVNNGPFGDENIGFIYNFEILEPDSVLTIDADIENVLIFGQNTGSVELSAAGGWGNFEFSDDGLNFDTNSVFENLFAGNYDFFVKDLNGCVQSKNVTISQPDKLILSADVSDVKCYGDSTGTITLSAHGGLGDYLYSFDNQGFTAVVYYSGLPVGDYQVIVRDSVGALDTAVVSVRQPDLLAVDTFLIDPATCGYNNGVATVYPQGGTAPYFYQWNDEYNQTTQTANNLYSGEYSVLITDNNACETTSSVIVPDLGAPDVTVDVENVICPDENSGEAVLHIAGGQNPFAIDWQDIENFNDTVAYDLPAGDYTVEVTDQNNCHTIVNFTITQPDSFEPDYSKTPPTCYGYDDGKIIVQMQGGTAPYSYLWNLSDTTINSDTLSNIQAGTYVLNITDSNACAYADTVVLQQTAPVNTMLEDSYTICQNSDLELTPQGDFVVYNWYSDEGTISDENSFTVSQEGTYYLYVENAKGCSATDTINIIVSDDLLHANFLLPSEANVNDTLVFIELSEPVPDSVTWTFPSSFIEYQSNDYFKFMIPSEPGTFIVRLDVSLGTCYDAIEKQIIILGDDSLAKKVDIPNPKVIKSIVLYPNPNDGIFTVEVELADEMDVYLDIFELQRSMKIYSASGNGQNFYRFDVNIQDAINGLYLMNIRTPFEQKNVKFIIRR